ncbi:MAG: RsmB/NOP family class I SAM-dependent RNA methyltransferase [Ignavibacteria bacterium]|nr:RsmB/NOP family class I SAM-dependent RNA methyltransferase [Ignavibacteria bacterium]
MIPISDKIAEYLTDLFGSDAVTHYGKYLEDDPATYLRSNSIKTNRDEVQKDLLSNYGIATVILSEISDALKVVGDKTFIGKTLEHSIGEYYIQSLSSMIPPIVLNPQPTDKVLDLCSAPGSKTTQLAALMQNKGTLLVNEIQLDRLKTLVFNLERMNVVNAGVIHSKGEVLSRFFQNHFDKILVDAPCSGLGILQKKNEVSNWWTKEKAEQLSELQYRLLLSALKMAKVGGEIVYSTCTLSVEENEFVIDKLLKKFPIKLLPITLPVHSHNAFTQFREVQLDESLQHAKRIIPWEVNSEGFFIVKILKEDEIDVDNPAERKRHPFTFIPARKLNKQLDFLTSIFEIKKSVFERYKYLQKGNDIFFVNEDWNEENLMMFERIGTKFANIDKYGNFILHTQAAEILKNEIHKNIVALSSNEELKKYLDGGTIKKDFPFRGQAVVKFRNKILGTGGISVDGLKSRYPRSKRTQEIEY